MEKRKLGYGECKCLDPLEKDYISLGLNKLLEEQNERIENIKEHRDVYEKLPGGAEGLLELYGRFKLDVELIKKKLEATPEYPYCEEREE